MTNSSFQAVGLGPRRQLQPPRGKPHIYRSCGLWVVRFYDPILKGARAMRFRARSTAFTVAQSWHEDWR